MKRLIIILVLLLLSLSLYANKKYVVVSFDGSKSLKMWRETLDFAKTNHINFTYFISAPYFISKDELETHPYHVMHRKNYSWLSWGENKARIRERIKYVNRALLEGNTIGSHSVGHFYGEKFTKQDWINELSFFKYVMDTRNELYNITNGTLSSKKIIGYRAPNLSMNSNGYYYLKQFGYKYDASLANPNYNVRHLFNSDLPIFPLSMLNIKDKKTVILMDYNFYYWDSQAKPIRDEKLVIRYTQKYRDYLLNEFLYGRRQVTIIGNHFSLWNGAAYWNGLKSFIKTVLDNTNYRKNAEFISMDKLYDLYKQGIVKKKCVVQDITMSKSSKD